MVTINVKCNPNDIDFKYLKCLLLNRLSEREFEVLFNIIKIGELTSSKRKELANKMNVTNYNMNNIIKKLKDKKLIYLTTDGYKSNVIIPSVKSITFNFVI